MGRAMCAARTVAPEKVRLGREFVFAGRSTARERQRAGASGPSDARGARIADLGLFRSPGCLCSKFTARRGEKPRTWTYRCSPIAVVAKAVSSGGSPAHSVHHIFAGGRRAAGGGERAS